MTAPICTTPVTVPSVNDPIVNYVTKFGDVIFAELFDIFGPTNVGPERARKAFIGQLRCLASSHKIVIRGRQAKGFSLDELVITLPDAATADSDGQAPAAPMRTQAPKYDAMHGDAYTHVFPAPTRAGALDFQLYQSHGYQC